jgi:coproporphyrinogen III oxidase-like Fe-S oxidoreductase
MPRKQRYSKFTPKQRAIKRRAVEVAAFFLGLWMQEQDVKEGKASYRKFLPADANWFEKFANKGALRRGSIMRQVAEKFGESEKQIYRDLQRVKREGWLDEVQAELDGTELRNTRGGIVFSLRSIRGRPTVAAVRRGAVRTS